MPTPKQVQQEQAIQGAQQGVAPMDFDPAEVMQEIAQKDVQLQMKEQELAQKEQQLQAMNQQIQEQQAAEAQAAEAQAQEQAQQPVPVAPVEGQTPPPQSPMQPPQQGHPDLSPQVMQQLQPGMKATVTKKIEMTPQGPVEVGRSENVSGGQQQQQQQQSPVR